MLNKGTSFDSGGGVKCFGTDEVWMISCSSQQTKGLDAIIDCLNWQIGNHDTASIIIFNYSTFEKRIIYSYLGHGGSRQQGLTPSNNGTTRSMYDGGQYPSASSR